MRLLNVAIWLCISVLISCSHAERDQSDSSISIEDIRPEFARGFGIRNFGDHKTVTVYSPFQGSSDSITYYLIKPGDDLKDRFKGKKVIEVPVETIICTSTTHIPLLDYLEEENALIGFPELDYISTPSVRERIDRGEITDLGTQINMNLEMLISLQPDLVMGYTLSGDLSQLNKIEKAGIPVVLNAEYLESHPLGRAEWIKFLAVFFDKRPLADSIFNSIKEEYLRVSNLVKGVAGQPDVLSGVVYGDTWFLPGGNNYASKIIKDAGANYIWGEDSSTGYLELSFESVYSKAEDVDFWIGVASYNTLKQLAAGDARYRDFRAFQDGRVYSYNNRTGEKGGNEYLELGYLRPDIILKDLVAIFHPELLDDHELYFYERLK